MLRAAACALLIAILLGNSFAAPRGGASHGGAVSAASHSAGAGGRNFRGSISSRPFGGDRTHHRHFGSYFYPYLLPYDEPLDYEEPYPEVAARPAPVSAPPQVQPQPVPVPKLIEVSGVGGAASARALPPAVFILVGGERVETSRFLLRAQDLSVTVNRQQRTIPISKLDLDATLAANHERGIELDIPSDPNQISLRF